MSFFERNIGWLKIEVGDLWLLSTVQVKLTFVFGKFLAFWKSCKPRAPPPSTQYHVSRFWQEGGHLNSPCRTNWPLPYYTFCTKINSLLKNISDKLARFERTSKVNKYLNVSHTKKQNWKNPTKMAGKWPRFRGPRPSWQLVWAMNWVDRLRTSADKRMWSGRRAVVMVRWAAVGCGCSALIRRSSWTGSWAAGHEG